MGRILFAIILMCTTAHASDLDAWVSRQLNTSIGKMLQNIAPEGTSPGAVVASPSKQNPDYFKHWVRDAGLTMNLVVSLYENATNAEQKAYYYRKMLEYVDFSRSNQTTSNPSGGLGEPLFYANGSAYNQGWGRPQNDSPAIRAYVLTRWAEILLREGKGNLVREKLYSPSLPAYTVIKADLEYTSHHWRETCFDLWEETRGHHFYTRMVQRKALFDGARLADQMGDGAAAQWYRDQAMQLSNAITSHWNAQKKILETTLDRDGGIDYKHSNLDASTILGIMHADTYDGFMPVQDDRALATAQRIMDDFKAIYPINHSGEGIAIGRYPEDRYDGNGFSEGNPWLLLTSGFAEYHYRVAKGLRADGRVIINDTNRPFFASISPEFSNKASGSKIDASMPAFQDLIRKIAERGDAFLKRVKRHTAEDGSMSEQLNKYNGYMQGARDLTWSYAAFIVAAWEKP